MFLLEFSSRIRVNIPNCVEEVIREDEEGALYMYSCSDLPIASLDLVSKAVEGQYLVAVIRRTPLRVWVGSWMLRLVKTLINTVMRYITYSSMFSANKPVFAVETPVPFTRHFIFAGDEVFEPDILEKPCETVYAVYALGEVSRLLT